MDNTQSVKEIIAALKLAELEELPGLLNRYSEDPRKQIQKALGVAKRRYEHELQERKRVRAMYDFMNTLAGKDAVVLGVDEVGRGAVAGPLTVCAVQLPKDPIIWGLNDSKKLSPHKREELAKTIAHFAPAIGIAHIDPEHIDAAGMSASLRVAINRAIKDSGLEPDLVLLDGNSMHAHPKEKNVIGGDAKVACIAAASIVAKVSRDSIMRMSELDYPGYSFAKSKGYASPEHIKAIQTLGPCEYHRKTFITSFLPQDSLF
ncbi:MAG: ribonuclease HII [Coriobacteriia bacterium]|nr:ribonuclease HII [Coriobacteriia bacterium]